MRPLLKKNIGCFLAVVMGLIFVVSPRDPWAMQDMSQDIYYSQTQDVAIHVLHEISNGIRKRPKGFPLISDFKEHLEIRRGPAPYFARLSCADALTITAAPFRPSHTMHPPGTYVFPSLGLEFQVTINLKEKTRQKMEHHINAYFEEMADCEQLSQQLVFKIDTTQSQFVQGEDVDFIITIKNTGEKKVALHQLTFDKRSFWLSFFHTEAGSFYGGAPFSTDMLPKKNLAPGATMVAHLSKKFPYQGEQKVVAYYAGLPQKRLHHSYTLCSNILTLDIQAAEPKTASQKRYDDIDMTLRIPPNQSPQDLSAELIFTNQGEHVRAVNYFYQEHGAFPQLGFLEVRGKDQLNLRKESDDNEVQSIMIPLQEATDFSQRILKPQESFLLTVHVAPYLADIERGHYLLSMTFGDGRMTTNEVPIMLHLNE